MHNKKLQKFSIFSAMKKILIISSVIGLFALMGCENEGCTDPDATNYDSAAEENDGSCLYDDDNNNETEAGQEALGTEGEEVSEEGPVSEGEGVSEGQPVAEGEGGGTDSISTEGEVSAEEEPSPESEGGVEELQPLN